MKMSKNEGPLNSGSAQPMESTQQQQQTRRWLLHERTETYEWSQKLHDHLQQMIVVAKMMLEKQQMDPAKASKEVYDVIQILDDAIDESRSLSRDLCPPLLFKNGLKPSLEWLTHWAAGHYGMPVHLHFTAQDGPFPEESGHYLIRLIKKVFQKVESLVHMMKAELRVIKEINGELRLELEIQGDSETFLQSKSKLSTHMKDICEHMTMLDGKCEIQLDENNSSVQISMVVPTYLT